MQQPWFPPSPGQVEALQVLHTPCMQLAAPQFTHAWPLVPHCAADSLVTQLFCEQHPLLHEVESHTQPVAVQCWPLEHWPPSLLVEHAQAPDAVHESAREPHELHWPPVAPQYDLEVGE